MESAAYLRRQANPADERVARVYLQEGGRALIAEIENVFGKLDRARYNPAVINRAGATPLPWFDASQHEPGSQDKPYCQRLVATRGRFLSVRRVDPAAASV
jgi:hypothetical protein